MFYLGTQAGLGGSVLQSISQFAAIRAKSQDWANCSGLVSRAFEPVVGEHRKVQQIDTAVTIQVTTDLLP